MDQESEDCFVKAIQALHRACSQGGKSGGPGTSASTSTTQATQSDALQGVASMSSMIKITSDQMLIRPLFGTAACNLFMGRFFYDVLVESKNNNVIGLSCSLDDLWTAVKDMVTAELTVCKLAKRHGFPVLSFELQMPNSDYSVVQECPVQVQRADELHGLDQLDLGNPEWQFKLPPVVKLKQLVEKMKHMGCDDIAIKLSHSPIAGYQPGGQSGAGAGDAPQYNMAQAEVAITVSGIHPDGEVEAVFNHNQFINPTANSALPAPAEMVFTAKELIAAITFFHLFPGWPLYGCLDSTTWRFTIILVLNNEGNQQGSMMAYTVPGKVT
ncbi:unnamed protein product [Vitrella brassicaformis CCMP3155]|uniref:Checkpoint protein n=1 Tax=Vitrella brassicaformis (strain CCMP3155) TaxID=1169540 RepID=A0A0G4F475_VITBC|nr:unnamed protein product [Vitrella brassicaformis CCMP3155]|eukprot:CEM06661.1 unnamed protein product [Vitrella brassicaformis CCMP3155]